MRVRAWIAAIALVAMTPSIAAAQEHDASSYDRLIDEALAEFDAGHFEEALSAFELAYKEKPSARALRGVAKALFELRAYARCLATIDRALASDVDPLPEALRADLLSLKERASHFVGEAVFDVTPRGAAIVVDGAGAATALDVGMHTVEISAPEHRTETRRFEIHGREITRVTVALEPLTLAPPPPPPTRGTYENRTLPLALTIGGVALSAGALVASSIWLVDRRDAVDQCNDVAGRGARCANSGPIAFQQDAATGTLVLSAAALVVSGVALYFLAR